MARAVIRAGLVAGAAAALMGPWATPALAGGGCHSATTQGEGDRVEMAKACFSPSVLRTDPGTEVTFVNRDPVVHNVSASEWGYFGDLNRGDDFTATFSEPGVYPFACTYHPGMVGAVVVGDPDPSDVALDAGTMADLGVEAAADDGDAGSGDAAGRPVSDSGAASDSLSPSILLGTIAVLGLAGAVAVILVRRRGRVEQGV